MILKTYELDVDSNIKGKLIVTFKFLEIYPGMLSIENLGGAVWVKASNYYMSRYYKYLH